MASYQKAPRYAKGISEAFVVDKVSGDILAYSNKFTTGNIEISENQGAIEGGLNNGLLLNIPDTRRMTGTFEAADYSLDIRAMQLGSTVDFNATILASEQITATDTTLTITGIPQPGYLQSGDAETYPCYVGDESANYGVDPTTKEVKNFTAEVGKTYCVRYWRQMVSAEVMPIPTSGSPLVAGMIIKTPMYSANGSDARNSTLSHMHYYVIPSAQFIGGNPGYSGSQTEASTTSWAFMALEDGAVSNETNCADCQGNKTVYGYEVIVPCNTTDELSAVKGLAIVGGIIALSADANASNHTAQLPVFYYMENGKLVTPTYTDLTYTSSNEAVTVSESGMLTGVSESNGVQVTATVTTKPSLTATVTVTVAAASN